MHLQLKRFFRQGAIRISRDTERSIYFYATIVSVVVYLVFRLQGTG